MVEDPFRNELIGYQYSINTNKAGTGALLFSCPEKTAFIEPLHGLLRGQGYFYIGCSIDALTGAVNASNGQILVCNIISYLFMRSRYILCLVEVFDTIYSARSSSIRQTQIICRDPPGIHGELYKKRRIIRDSARILNKYSLCRGVCRGLFAAVTDA